MRDLELGESLEDRVQGRVLVVARLHGLHQDQAVQAHDDVEASPCGPENPCGDEDLQSLHVEGAGRARSLDRLPHVFLPGGVEEAVGVEASHAPFGPGVAMAMTSLRVSVLMMEAPCHVKSAACWALVKSSSQSRAS